MRWYIREDDLHGSDAVSELLRRIVATGQWVYDPIMQVWRPSNDLDKAHRLLSQCVGWQRDAEIIKVKQEQEIERLRAAVETQGNEIDRLCALLLAEKELNERLRAENDMLRSLVIDAPTKEERDRLFDQRFGTSEQSATGELEKLDPAGMGLKRND